MLKRRLAVLRYDAHGDATLLAKELGVHLPQVCC